jgi:pimeloyl-ACP methyl ester carboxylesterase
MADIQVFVNKAKLSILSVLTPIAAGKLATGLFTQSRNAANPHKEAFTPMGAKAIPFEDKASKVKNIYVWGDEGDIVLLLHGWGSDCSSMFGFTKSLLDEGYRVATFDAPAHGSSKGESATMYEYMVAANTAIKSLGAVRKVVAHSLGGIIAIATAAQNKGIDQVILVSAPFSLLDVLDIWSKGFMKLSDRIRERILAELLVLNGVPVSYWDIGLHGKELNIPIHVIHDEHDPVVNVSHSRRILNVLRKVSCQYTKGLGHAKILLSKDVHKEVAGFFREVNSQPIQGVA